MKGNIQKGRILIKELTPEEEVVGGIIIPKTALKQRTGKVILVGEESDVKVGDVIYFGERTRTTKVFIEEEGYLLMPCEDVLYIE